MDPELTAIELADRIENYATISHEEAVRVAAWYMEHSRDAHYGRASTIANWVAYEVERAREVGDDAILEIGANHSSTGITVTINIDIS